MSTIDETTLRARWSKRERDVVFSGPRRCDMRLTYSAMACRQADYMGNFKDPPFLDELEARGYDLTTLKFSIKRKAAPPEEVPKGDTT